MSAIVSGRIHSDGKVEDVLDDIYQVVDQLIDGSIAAIGIGVPSVVDVAEGIVYDVQYIPSWVEVPLKKLMEARYHIPVFVNNDANCFALGEYHFGKGKGADSMIGLTLGTGLGAGVIISHKLYPGYNCGAGEFGLFGYKDNVLEYYSSGSFFQNVYNLIALDLASVKRNLELVSTIDSVSIERVLPRTLKIRVTERQPIAQVNVPRADSKNGIAISVVQLDADGFVMQPLDPRLCVIPLSQMNSLLPVVTGLNGYQLQAGHRIELPQAQAALKLIGAFKRSPMAGLVDLRRIDVSAPGVIVATTGQGGEITFALDNLEQQLRRWREIYDLGMSKNKMIASLDLAVANNVPVRWAEISFTPAVAPKILTPATLRRKNV